MAGPMRARSRDVQREIDRLGEVVARLQQRDITMRRLLLLPTPDPRRADCEIRIDCTNYTKASASGMTRFYGRTQRLTRAGSAVIAAAVVDCSGMAVARLQRAFGKLGEADVDQMARKDLPRAGRLLSASVGDDGRVALRVLVSDPTAAAKAVGTVYSGLLVDLAGDEVDGISLVDTPYGFTKGLGDGARMIAKIFARGGLAVKKPVAIYTK